TPFATPRFTAPFAAFTASARARSERLTPTMTLLNPNVIAFGTIGMSLQEVAMRGATNARGPPFTVTFGLPIATEPWAPGYGIGGISSFTHVCHFVKLEKLAMMEL